MSEPLSKKLGISPIEEGTIVSGLMNGRECDAYIEGHNRAVRKLDQRSPDVVKLAFIIYKVGMRNLASEDEIKSTFNMHYVTWNPTVNECYVKAQEIINKMSVWIVKKG